MVNTYGPPRDFACSVYHGSEEDGLNISIGVLTAEQAAKFISDYPYKRSREPVAIQDGALLIDLDRYITNIRKREQIDHLIGEHQSLFKVAEAVAAKLLSEEEAKIQ